MSAISLTVLISCFGCQEKPEGVQPGEFYNPDGNTTVDISVNNNDVLRNPLNGWVLYLDATADPSYFDKEIYSAELGKNVPVDIPVLGDCRKTLAMLTERLVKVDRTEWIDSFRKYQDEEYEKVISRELQPSGDTLRMGEVVDAVSRATDHKAILVTDVGQNQMMAARYFSFTEKRSIITSGGMGTMGYAIPAGIGAAYARPDRTVCVFMGDGGLQMTVEEFGTIMEHRIPVKMILLNNSYLGNVRQWQELFYNRRYSFTRMTNPDFQILASAYGIPSRRVIDRKDLRDAVREMLETDGPFFLEACVEEEENVMPMTPPGNSIDDMLMEC